MHETLNDHGERCLTQPEWRMCFLVGSDVVALSGVLDVVATSAMHGALLGCVSEAAGRLTIDLSGVTLLSAAAIGALVRTKAAAADEGIGLCLRLVRGSLTHRVAAVTLERSWPVELVDAIG